VSGTKTGRGAGVLDAPYIKPNRQKQTLAKVVFPPVIVRSVGDLFLILLRVYAPA
jgi:hypothetical protein